MSWVPIPKFEDPSKTSVFIKNNFAPNQDLNQKPAIFGLEDGRFFVGTYNMVKRQIHNNWVDNPIQKYLQIDRSKGNIRELGRVTNAGYDNINQNMDGVPVSYNVLDYTFEDPYGIKRSFNEKQIANKNFYIWDDGSTPMGGKKRKKSLKRKITKKYKKITRKLRNLKKTIKKRFSSKR
jgi:hypothetical protein